MGDVWAERSCRVALSSEGEGERVASGGELVKVELVKVRSSAGASRRGKLIVPLRLHAVCVCVCVRSRRMLR